MRRPSKYQPLSDYLRRSRQVEVSLPLSEIEAMLGFPLPPSARTQRGWWSNRDPKGGALQASAWRGAGYHVVALDLEQEQITFRKTQRAYQVQRQGDTILWNGELIKALRWHAGWNQAQLAEALGVRQQTVSEWETGVYAPGRQTSKHLSLVAERAGFYGVEPEN